MRPLCFVIMPFGTKPDPSGGPPIDFDAIFAQALGPGVEDAGLEPIRADAEQTGGVIHTAMFERLLLCDYAIADLTAANANVFYELGVRHAARPHTTLPMFAEGRQLPFDVNLLRCLPYALGDDNRLTDPQATRAAVAERLSTLMDSTRRHETPDSPVYQLVQGLEPPDIDRLRTDTFRDQAGYSAEVRKRLAAARADKRPDVLDTIEEELRGTDSHQFAALVDLMLSRRALSDWEGMVRVAEAMPRELNRSRLVQEQLGLALNRAGRRGDAIAVLTSLVDSHGSSSETNGILGRVYKDQWTEALRDGDEATARTALLKAIDAYRTGFQSDWRDAYPGINLVTLLEIHGTRRALRERDQVVPVVRYAVMRRLAGQPDYWDHATLLELAVLAEDEGAVEEHLEDCLTTIRESWEAATTANNLRLIRDAREQRGQTAPWLGDAITTLEARAER